MEQVQVAVTVRLFIVQLKIKLKKLVFGYHKNLKRNKYKFNHIMGHYHQKRGQMLILTFLLEKQRLLLLLLHLEWVLINLTQDVSYIMVLRKR
jgi:hypothetical protein